MKRPLLKMWLTANDITHRALAVVARWKRGRAASYNLPRAILIYDALLNGDTAPLLEEFPLLANTMHHSTESYTPPKRDYGDAEIEYVEETMEEKIENFKNSFGGF